MSPVATPPNASTRRPGRRIARRALITTVAAASVCAAGAVAAPYVVPAVETKLEDAALSAALKELTQLEGVPIDAAIRAAEITRAAVGVIVLPVARLVALLGSGALALLLRSLDAAHAALAFIHADTTGVDALRTVVASWQVGIGSLPIALDAYLTADITSAEAYLKALKKLMAAHNANGQ
ncbi:MAG TPA: hypothetical protein VJQ45_07180 [Ktedonobacterales bacterium]|nr:hypothetical protein [Ktedonobacterales bacterium]